MKKIGKNKALAVVSWIFTAIIAIIIFRFSCDTAEESSEISKNLFDVIIEFIGNIIGHEAFREFAHFCEFAALGFFMAGSFKFTWDKLKFCLPLIPCALYAVSDEIHQIFVPGRAFEIFDIFVDSCGSLTGILVFMLLIFIIEKAINKNKA